MFGFKMEVVVWDILCSHKEVPVAMTEVKRLSLLNKAHYLGRPFSAMQWHILNCQFFVDKSDVLEELE